MTASARPRLLDGAMGTELMRRGYAMRAPRWGAGALEDAPELVTQIHRAYAEAGADTLRTNTFGLRAADAPWCAVAVDALRRAAPTATIVGAVGPANPAAPPEQRREHYTALGDALTRAGAQILMAETHTTLRGAREASDALRAFDIPVWAALSCGPDGATLGGEALAGAQLDVDVLVVGCTEARGLAPALLALRATTPGISMGVVPSTASTRTGAFDPAGTQETAVAAAVCRELATGPLAVVGGCCGTSPAFTAELYARLGVA